jgi:glycogen(starch) synthase
MSDEITELFGPGLAETRVIRNGIDTALWPSPSQPETVLRS